MAGDLLRKHLETSTRSMLRFKVIDLFEPPKAEVLDLLHNSASGGHVDRRARIYYHKKPSQLLRKAIVNVSSRQVESDQEIADVQGPVDWVEFAQVEEACNEHPLVKAEVEKLQLPKGWV